MEPHLFFFVDFLLVKKNNNNKKANKGVGAHGKAPLMNQNIF